MSIGPATRPSTGQDPTVLVVRDEHRIRFSGRVDWFAHLQFGRCLHDWRERAYRDLLLDFTKCESAFPNGMLPLLAELDVLRREEISVAIVLPAEDWLRRLFLNTNWAHYLDPDNYEKSDTVHDRHVAAHRFADFAGQQRLVNDFVDIVMRHLRMGRRVITALEWCVNEITENVLRHADCREGGIVQVSTFSDARRVTIGVADSGRGILASMREGHSSLQTDRQAIEEAVKSGATRDPKNGQGNGIAGTMGIAKASGGSFAITSGRAALVVSEPRVKPYGRARHLRFPGTFVYAEIGLDTPFRVAEAIGVAVERGDPIDIIETAYEVEDGSALNLSLRGESKGFGTRYVGRQLRTKCRNLLDSAPGKPLVLDWQEISVVSSSFADEFIGKLFVELTPLVFAARVRNVRMEPLVRGLVDKAIMQRVAQAATENDPNLGGTSGDSGSP